MTKTTSYSYLILAILGLFAAFSTGQFAVGGGEVFGRLLRFNDSVLVAPVALSGILTTGSVDIVYNPLHQEYFVAFLSEGVNSRQTSVLAQRVALDGTPIDNGFTILAGNSDNGGKKNLQIAHNTVDDTYLIIFEYIILDEGSQDTPLLSAFVVNHFGTSISNRKILSFLSDRPCVNPRVNYNPLQNIYHLTYTVEGLTTQIATSKLDASGVVFGPIVLLDHAGQKTDTSSIVFRQDNNETVLAAKVTSGGTSDLFVLQGDVFAPTTDFDSADLWISSPFGVASPFVLNIDSHVYVAFVDQNSDWKSVHVHRYPLENLLTTPDTRTFFNNTEISSVRLTKGASNQIIITCVTDNRDIETITIQADDLAPVVGLSFQIDIPRFNANYQAASPASAFNIDNGDTFYIYLTRELLPVSLTTGFAGFTTAATTGVNNVSPPFDNSRAVAAGVTVAVLFVVIVAGTIGAFLLWKRKRQTDVKDQKLASAQHELEQAEQSKQ